MNEVVKRRWRWWYWIALILALVLLVIVGGALAWSWSAQRDYHEAVATWRSRGYPQDELAMRAQLTDPAFDISMIDDWQAVAWSTSAVDDLDYLLGLNDPDIVAWLLADGAEPTVELSRTGATVPVTTIITAVGTVMQPVGVLLDRPGLCLNWSAFREAEAARTTGDLPMSYNADTVGLLEARAVASWLTWQLMLAEDPAVPLARFERLVQALDQPHLLIDGMIAIAIAAMRDQAVVMALRRGRLNEAQLAGWLAESYDLDQQVDLVLGGDGAIFTQGLSGKIVEEQWWPDDAGIMEDWITVPGVRWAMTAVVAPRDFAIIVDLQTRTLDWWRAGAAGPIPDWRQAVRQTWVWGLLDSGFIESSAVTMWQHEADRRAARIAASILLAARQNRAIPTTHAEALKRYPGLTAVSPQRAQLRYEWLGDDGFRIGIDPHGPEIVPGTASRYANRWAVEIRTPSP